MMAAVAAAQCGNRVTLFEKNEKLGKEAFYHRKGRCNITNNAEVEDLFPAVISNPKFLYSAFYSFTNEQTVEFFEDLGVKTKVERGGRVFPLSDHSSDVIRALEREMKRLNVRVFLNSEVCGLSVRDDEVKGIVVSGGRKIRGDAVIVATGGISYPSPAQRGRVPFCKGMRASYLGSFPCPCADGSKRGLYGRADGPFPSQCGNLHHRWEEKTVRRFRRNAFHTLRRNRTCNFKRQQCGREKTERA